MIDSWRALAFRKDKIAITAAIDAFLMAIHGYKPFYFADGFGHRDAFRIAIIPHPVAEAGRRRIVAFMFAAAS